MMAILFVALATMVQQAATSSDVGWPAPIRLRVEGREQQQQGGEGGLVTLSNPFPRFAFDHGLVSRETGVVAVPRGLGQTAYRITVVRTDGCGACSSSGGSTVWDSKVVNSTSCSQISYPPDGLPLVAFDRYRWTVKWQATDGAWSAEATATFEMGPMLASDWSNAAWLVGSQLRAEFALPKGFTSRHNQSTEAPPPAPTTTVVVVRAPTVLSRGSVLQCRYTDVYHSCVSKK